MYVTLTNLTVREEDFSQYVDLRRRLVNPAMRSWPGSDGSMLLRRRTNGAQGGVALTLVNLWDTADSQREWADSKLHVELNGNLNKVVSSSAYRLFRRIDGSSVTIGTPMATGMAAIGIHHVSGGRTQEYLARRRDIVHPSMSQAEGFIGTWVLADPDDRDSFTCFFQWESDMAADTYYDSPEHRGPVSNSVTSLCDGSVASIRYDVVPVDEPWGTMSRGGAREMSASAI